MTEVEAIMAAAEKIAAAVSLPGWRVALEIVLSLASAIALGVGAYGAYKIPQTVDQNARAREKIAESIDLISKLKGDPQFLDRAARVHAWRMINHFGRSDIVDPYQNTYLTVEHDLGALLNFFDSLCVEIENGYVDQNLIKQAAKDEVVGAYKRIDTFHDLMSGSEKPQWPNLEAVGKRWENEVPAVQREMPNVKSS